MQIDSRQLISIIIPVYNRANLINRTILSVLAQSYKNFELIIVDDGSTDNLESKLSTHIDQRIYFIRLQNNEGVSAARNFGLSKCTGDAIVFLDSDDELNPDYLDRMIKKQIQFDSEITICRAAYQKNTFKPGIGELSDLLKSELKVNHLLMGNILPLPCILFSKKIRAECYFDTSIRSYEDFDFILSVFKKFNKITTVDEILVKVNDTPNSVNKNIPAIFSALKDIKYKFSKHLSNNKKTDFYFKKNMYSLCKKEMQIFERLFFFFSLVLNSEFLVFAVKKLLRLKFYE